MGKNSAKSIELNNMSSNSQICRSNFVLKDGLKISFPFIHLTVYGL